MHPYSHLPTVTYKFKTTPYKHQVKAMRVALRSLTRSRAAALFMPMRSGKTKTAIDLVGVLHMKFGVRRVLVVCPLSVVGVWRNQIRTHTDAPVEWVIINYERTYDRAMNGDGWTPKARVELHAFDPEVIIVDEAHKIGDASAVQSKYLYKLQKEIKCDPFKIILTGTPFHRKPLRIFGMFKFLDEDVFGTTFFKFKKRYAVTGGYGGFKILKYKNKGELLKKIRRYAFMMKTLPVVPPQYEVVPYNLEESEKAYQSMSDDFIAEIGDGVVEAPIALVKALRLAQLCGGRLRDSEGAMQRVGFEKRREFTGLVEQFQENELQKFVVFARFVPELKDIVDVCRAAGYRVYLMYGKTPAQLREQRLVEFNETTDKAVFISQVSTGSLGIDLSSASVTVFYSLPESLVTYDQAIHRIRKFKDQRTLSYYFLCGRGTVEEVNLAALRANLDLIDILERDPKLLSYSAKG